MANKNFEIVQKLVSWSYIYGLDLSNWASYVSFWFWNDYIGDAYEVRFENIELLVIDFLRMEEHLNEEESRERFETLKAEYRIPICLSNLSPLQKNASVFMLGECGRIDFASESVSYFSQGTALADVYWHQAPKYKLIRPNIDVLAEVESIQQEPSILYDGESVEQDLNLIFSDAELIDIDLSKWEKMLEIWVISDLMWSVIFPDDQIKSRNPILRVQFHKMHIFRIDFFDDKKTRWDISEMKYEEKESLIYIEFSGTSSKISVVCEKITFFRGSDTVFDTLFPDWGNREGLARPDQKEMAIKLASYSSGAGS